MPSFAESLADVSWIENEEQARLAALADLYVVEGGPELSFDRIAAIAAESLRFPMAYVSLIAANRQILKTHSAPLPCESARTAAFCSTTVEQGKPLVIEDARSHRMFADFPQVKGPPFVRAYWGVPLTTRSGHNIGAFCLIDQIPRCPTDKELASLSQFARLTVEFMELRAQATTDLLTGLLTRRAFFTEGNRLFAYRDVARGQFTCLAIDLDHFKRINDSFGHAAGDRVLQQVGKLLSSQLRPDSIVGRIGGEEFAVILPGEHIEGALQVAERIRSTLSAANYAGLPRFTASIGVSARQGCDREMKDVLERADNAAYQAKNAGRNCVRCSAT
ncbi:MAG TPA: sensor domain-containing diguanylate cyclase [Sphingobium sp.]|nr:sensor domain-containing diguanylate cyclase [Sphingobium sp.]